MIKSLKNKKNKKGFTLMEMLIVIAIIAILIAVAIPALTKALDKAKYTTDVANVRSWYAQVQVDVLMANDGETISWADDADVTGSFPSTMQITNSTITYNEASGNTGFTLTYTPGTNVYSSTPVVIGGETYTSPLS